jgi:cell division protein FtsQ
VSDSRNHDHVPDRAALEELHRAFGREPEDAGDGTDDEDGTDATSDATPDWLEDDDASPTATAADDLVIVEQVPPEPPEPAEPPRIIRIDGLGGDDPGDIADPAPSDGVDPPPSGDASGAADASGAPGIITIDDADLPDAVYVQGSLDADGSHSIVIIEDDDTGDTISPDAERDIRRGIEPRMRERRVAVKRAQGRKRLKWVALVGGLLAVAVGALTVLGSPWFAVRADQVTVTGDVYTDPDELQAVIDDLVGTPSLRVDTQGLEERLEAIPWVDSARVRVDFPHAASVEIRERQAWATYQGPDRSYRVIDDEGRVLDVLDGYPFAYVLITGPDPVDLEPGDFAPRGYAAAADLAKNLTGAVRGRVTSIEVTADGSRLSLQLDGGLSVRFGEARDLLPKLVRLETVLSSGAELPPGVIDVSTREVTLPPGGVEDGDAG